MANDSSSTNNDGEPKADQDRGASSPEHPSADARPGKSRLRTGVAVGIGSAAIVAALLYANRGRKNDKGSD
jgi:hypothetical protein